MYLLLDTFSVGWLTQGKTKLDLWLPAGHVYYLLTIFFKHNLFSVRRPAGKMKGNRQISVNDHKDTSPFQAGNAI